MIKKPFSVQIGITERCNLRCVHCDIWKKEKNSELTSGEWLEIIARIRAWLGPYWVNISGGEPFIREDLIEIIEFCTKSEIRPIVTTNATLLNEDIIKKLSDIDNLTLNISLDSVNPKTHDYLRGRAGTYQKVINVLNSFKANHRKCHITLATILMGYNITEIINIIKTVVVGKLADGVNFQALDHNFGAVYDTNWHRKNLLWPSEVNRGYFISVLDKLINLKQNGMQIYNPVKQLEHFKNYFSRIEERLPIPCNTADINFIINPSGEVLLCWNMEPIGDITKEEPEQIWNSSRADKRRDEIKNCSRTCRILNCNFNE